MSGHRRWEDVKREHLERSHTEHAQPELPMAECAKCVSVAETMARLKVSMEQNRAALDRLAD